MNKNMTRCFLDTSVQLRRLLSTEDHRRQLSEKLKGKQVYSSTYVQMELRRTILKDLCYVKSIIDVDCGDDENALHCLDRAEEEVDFANRTFSKISESRARLSIRLVRGQFEHSEFVSRTEMLEFLRFQIEMLEAESTYLRFGNGQTVAIKFINGTDCDLAKGSFGCNIRKMTCKREFANCELPHFLMAKEEEILSLEAELLSEDSVQARRHKGVIRLLTEESRYELAQGQENCWRISAAIKCLEAEQNSLICTKDPFVRKTSSVLNLNVSDAY